MNTQLMIAICFNTEAGNWVNGLSKTFGVEPTSNMMDKVINNSVVRTFYTEPEKEAYMMALDDTHSKFIELTPEAIETINLVKPIQHV